MDPLRQGGGAADPPGGDPGGPVQRVHHRLAAAGYERHRGGPAHPQGDRRAGAHHRAHRLRLVGHRGGGPGGGGHRLLQQAPVPVGAAKLPAERGKRRGGAGREQPDALLFRHRAHPAGGGQRAEPGDRHRDFGGGRLHCGDGGERAERSGDGGALPAGVLSAGADGCADAGDERL